MADVDGTGSGALSSIEFLRGLSECSTAQHTQAARTAECECSLDSRLDSHSGSWDLAVPAGSCLLGLTHHPKSAVPESLEPHSTEKVTGCSGKSHSPRQARLEPIKFGLDQPLPPTPKRVHASSSHQERRGDVADVTPRRCQARSRGPVCGLLSAQPGAQSPRLTVECSPLERWLYWAAANGVPSSC